MSGVGFDDTDGSSRRQRSSTASAMLFEYDDDDDGTRRLRLDPSLDPSDDDWITEIEQDARSFDAKLPELRLNGTGKKYDDCGEVELPVVLCDDCLERTWADRTCRRAACPRCHQSHEFHGAKTDAAKADALRRKRNVIENTTAYKQHHVVFSSPTSLRFDSKEPLKRGKELVKHLAAGVGIDAGMVACHPYRIVKEYRGDVNGHASGDGDMTWADIMTMTDADNGWSWEAIKSEFLVYAPHFHVVGLSKFVQGGAVTEAISEKTGFVIHRITKGEDSSVSLYDQEDLCRAVAYCRTHAGLSWNEETEEFRAAVWRFGEVANIDASEGVTAEIDQKMRDVSHDVLGVDFSRADSCREKVAVESDDDESGAESPSASASPSPSRSPVSVAVAVSASGPTDDRSLGPSDGTAMTDGGTWDETAGVVPDFADEPMPADTEDRENTGTERCGGDFVPMKYAPMYFEDDDLAEKMPDRVEDLKEDYEIWKSGGRPPD